MRYISLAADPAPTYAGHAPVAARQWLRLGYRTIIHILDSEAWRTPFGELVLGELAAIESAVVRLPVTPPLGVANTMRAARLVAPWVNGLATDDFVMLADVDMYPLSRTFFADPAPFTVLRALYASWLGCKTPPPMIDWEAVRPGWRFQMCYAGARVDIWRELWDLPVADSAAALAKLVDGTTYDASDFDEAKLSYAFLSARRAQGGWTWLDTAGVWRSGELVFVDPLGAPLLSKYYNMPRGLIGPEDDAVAKSLPPAAIDFIPPRFSRDTRDYWCFDVAAGYWPEEREWLTGYRERLDRVLATGRWA